MKLFKPKRFKKFISLFIIYFFMNNLIASESENKLDNLNNNYNNNQFEEKYFQDSITFNEYDSLESQLKIFFGRLECLTTF